MGYQLMGNLICPTTEQTDYPTSVGQILTNSCVDSMLLGIG